MKKLFIITIAALLASTAQASGKEDLCLGMGSLGQTLAQRRAEGATEASLLNIVAKAKIDKTPGFDTVLATQLAIQYIFTMRVKPADARQIIYLKCLAGDFGLI